MKPPQVFFSEKFEPTVIKILFEKACQCENGDIQKADRTAIKVHFGEKSNWRFVPPRSIKPVVDALKAMNSDFFLDRCQYPLQGDEAECDGPSEDSHEAWVQARWGPGS